MSDRPMLVPVDYCPHTSGIVVSGDDDIRCGDCHTVMVWIARKDLEQLRRPPSEVEEQLREQLQHEEAQLRTIHTLLGNILMTRGPM